jgi:peptidoglycan/LPS O-acetylase OafA/YrhL
MDMVGILLVMKASHAQPNQTSNNIRIVALIVGVLLIIPLVFTLMGDGSDGQGWNWKLNDFILAGVLLFGVGALLDYMARKIKEPKQRLIAAGVILLAFAAVGLFGSPISGS